MGSRIYDNWDRLIGATLKREQFRELARAHSRDPSLSSVSSDFSSTSSLASPLQDRSLIYPEGTVHPTPPVVSDQLLSFLPATILTLTVALSPEEKQLLAYLISRSSPTNFPNNHRKPAKKRTISAAACFGSKADADHPPSVNCQCFRCYVSYWTMWDSSPNRQLIDEVIEAYEDSLDAK